MAFLIEIMLEARKQFITVEPELERNPSLRSTRSRFLFRWSNARSLVPKSSSDSNETITAFA